MTMNPKMLFGSPTPRIDGVAKVTGAARYASDELVANPAFAYLVTSAIARGYISGFDLSRAKAVSGVLDILTCETVGNQIKAPSGPDGGPTTTTLESNRIWHGGQIIAVVVADTFEAATEAAGKVRANTVAEPPSASFDAPGAEVEALRQGEVDAIVVNGQAGPQVYTLENADRPYRIIVERMQEGALTLSPEGIVLYANRSLSRLLRSPGEAILGRRFQDFVAAQDQEVLARLLAESEHGGGRGVLELSVIYQAMGRTLAPVPHLESAVISAGVLAAAALGAGISMAFAEALSDDGSLTGRGAPVMRGAVTGSMTAVGGLGHALPYLIPQFYTATIVAFAVVAVELGVIAWIRTRYMDTPFLQAAFQVVVGGVLVFAAGILIGSS